MHWMFIRFPTGGAWAMAAPAQNDRKMAMISLFMLPPSILVCAETGISLPGRGHGADVAMTPEPQSRARLWIAKAFSAVEDLVYVSLGLILAGAAIVLLISAVTTFVQKFAAGTLVLGMVTLLDQILLILLVVELLYTVQVSFREHAVVPEPFLLVGLIAAIRRVLILTAIFGETGP